VTKKYINIIVEPLSSPCHKFNSDFRRPTKLTFMKSKMMAASHRKMNCNHIDFEQAYQNFPLQINT